MTREPPPPVLDSARVIAYAFVGDIPYRKWGALYVGEKLIEHVPRLAICVNLGKDVGSLLLHCDDEWTVLGTSGVETVEAAKQRAAKNYPGVSSRWVEVNVSVKDALRYYDAQTDGLKCSFCGKRPFELDGWFEGNHAAICRSCVEKYYDAFQKPDGDDDAR